MPLLTILFDPFVITLASGSKFSHEWLLLCYIGDYNIWFGIKIMDSNSPVVKVNLEGISNGE